MIGGALIFAFGCIFGAAIFLVGYGAGNGRKDS